LEGNSVTVRNRSDHDIKFKIQAWFDLSRLSFHSVGILPFFLGTFLAWKIAGFFDATVFILGNIAIILIMLSTYHAGEYADHEEDKISKRLFNSRFSGGSGVIPAGALSRQVPFWTSLITFSMAAVIGIMLQYYFKTGSYTLILGCLGAFPGFFYSTKPVRLVEKGIGEMFIGFCFGWLPIASAFYIQTGFIHPMIHWMGLPVGLSIINVILLNEFPDYTADSSVGKRNMLVRLGKKAGGLAYMLFSILAWTFMFLSIGAGVPAKALYVYLPILGLSAFLVWMVLIKKYENPKTLEVLCGLNIAVNLGTTAAYLFAYM